MYHQVRNTCRYVLQDWPARWDSGGAIMIDASVGPTIANLSELLGG